MFVTGVGPLNVTVSLRNKFEISLFYSILSLEHLFRYHSICYMHQEWRVGL